MKLSDHIGETVLFIENADMVMAAVLEAVEFYGESDDDDNNDIELKFRAYDDTVSLSEDTGIAIKNEDNSAYIVVRDDSGLFDKSESLFLVMDYGQ